MSDEPRTPKLTAEERDEWFKDVFTRWNHAREERLKEGRDKDATWWSTYYYQDVKLLWELPHDLHKQLKEVNKEADAAAKMISAYREELREIERELASALGYKYEEGYGWVTGDHTPVTLASEARDRIRALNFTIRKMEEEGE